MGLVSRTSSQFIVGMGLMQLFFATGLTVCGFIVLGLFHNLDCKGIWLGLPMMVPGIVSIIAMGTRHRLATMTVLLTSIVILGIGAYHVYDVYDDTDYWKKYRKYAEQDSVGGSLATPCYNRGDHCVCDDSEEYLKKGYTVQRCDQFRTGEELFWTMIALTVGGLLFSLLNVFVSLWGSLRLVKEDYDKTDAPDYNISGTKYNYALNH